MAFKAVHLSSGFMLSSVLGIIISLVWVMDKSITWGVTFFVVFVIMLISALISMTHEPVEDDLAVHEPRHKKERQKLLHEADLERKRILHRAVKKSKKKRVIKGKKRHFLPKRK